MAPGPPGITPAAAAAEDEDNKDKGAATTTPALAVPTVTASEHGSHAHGKHYHQHSRSQSHSHAHAHAHHHYEPAATAHESETDDFRDNVSVTLSVSDWGNDDFSVTTSPSLRPSQSPPTSPRLDGAFLHPQRSLPSLRPPTLTPSLTFTMASPIEEDPVSAGEANGSAPVPIPAASATSPFNFQTQFMSTGPVKSNIGQRRGHRYKHSSISAQHQIFQEPPPRPPPVLPASLPVPTLREAWASMQREQRHRLYWCCCHAAVAVYIFLGAGSGGSLAMTALSHLVFFDVGSAAVCVAVDVLGNFEVWRRSSVRHPFGLQRAEVLAGFAMSVFLVFGGFDLLSHNLKHVLEGVGHHDPHHPHPHGGHSGGGNKIPTGWESGSDGISPGTIDMASLLAVVSTLVSAYGLKNHNRIRRVMRLPWGLGAGVLPAVLDNPFHSLTLFFSGLMLLLPLLSVAYFLWLDRLLCAAIAISMFLLGSRLAVAQGLMLLMSYNGGGGSSTWGSCGGGKLKIGGGKFRDGGDGERGTSGVSAVVREIESEPTVARVEEAQFWQVHYGLAMANLKVCLVRGCDDGTLSQLRARVARVIQNKLGEGYGRGGNLRWEVTVQTSTDVN